MNIVTELKEWQAIRKNISGYRLGFVPTMGNLHLGHISLCSRAKIENDITVASIFVNPTQFNVTHDFDTYPRTIEKDTALLVASGVDYLLIPNATEMYQDNYQVQVSETNLGLELEGEYRPGHFSGMLTVVLKLLNLVQPDRAYFGEKDYQQYLLIKKMVSALFLATDIVPCPTIRAEDGLALSSRNSRLNFEQRAKAAHFPKLLHSALAVEVVAKQLSDLGFKVDYIVEKWQRRLGAIWIDDIRLIDNLEQSSVLS